MDDVPYKVGDKVIIKRDLTASYRDCFVPSMKVYLGKEAVIRHIRKREIAGAMYKLQIDGKDKGWNWEAHMFEKQFQSEKEKNLFIVKNRIKV